MLLVDLHILVKFVHKSSSGKMCLPFLFETHFAFKSREVNPLLFRWPIVDS